LYRELFHDKGVRFIAVNDNVDSESGEDDFTPFREILNKSLSFGDPQDSPQAA